MYVESVAFNSCIDTFFYNIFSFCSSWWKTADWPQALQDETLQRSYLPAVTKKMIEMKKGIFIWIETKECFQNADNETCKLTSLYLPQM